MLQLISDKGLLSSVWNHFITPFPTMQQLLPGLNYKKYLLQSQYAAIKMPLPSVFEDMVWIKSFWGKYIHLELTTKGFEEHKGRVVMNMPVAMVTVSTYLYRFFYQPHGDDVHLSFNSPSVPESLVIAYPHAIPLKTHRDVSIWC